MGSTFWGALLDIRWLLGPRAILMSTAIVREPLFSSGMVIKTTRDRLGKVFGK
jgi:hypothetical protein